MPTRSTASPGTVVQPRRFGTIANLTAALFAAAIPGALPTAVSAGAAVQCYNELLGTVQKTLESDCEGRIVGDAEAETLRKERRAYIERAIGESNVSLVLGKQLARSGSGFFVSADGSVLTSHHVIADCDAVSIAPTFGAMALASSIVADEPNDLALLRASIQPPAVAPLAERNDHLMLGPTFVIGYPNRGLVTMEPVLSTVEILVRESHTDKVPAIVVKGDVRPGNSGGPLLDGSGNVLGVVFAKVDSVNTYKASGTLVQDVALALPVRVVQDFLDRNGIIFQQSYNRPVQTADRLLQDARPFVVQVGCWK